MRRFLFLMACAAMAAACQPKLGPDATVRAIYAVTAEKIGHEGTPVDAIPMTDDLKQQFNAAQAAADQRQEPFIEGDLAADCQDCDALADLTITTKTPPANGRAVVEATFKIDGEQRVVDWAMVDTPQGWRVDNISSPGGSDLRAAIREQLAPAPQQQSCAAERGAQAAATLVAACIEVSPATHPPCNVENSCALIEDEIKRSCALFGEGQKPPACATVQ